MIGKMREKRAQEIIEAATKEIISEICSSRKRALNR